MRCITSSTLVLACLDLDGVTPLQVAFDRPVHGPVALGRWLRHVVRSA